MKEIELACVREVLTIAEASKLFGVSRKRIHDLVLSGGIVARQSSTVWLLSRTSCEKRWSVKHGHNSQG